MVVKAIAAGFAQNVDCTAVYIWIFKDKKSNCAPMCKSLCCKMCKIVLIVQTYAKKNAMYVTCTKCKEKFCKKLMQKKRECRKG